MSRLLEYLESREYNELTAEEKQWVDQYISEEEYSLRRTIVVAATEMPQTEVPRPLILPQKTPPIPLFLTAFSSAAAAAILVFLFVKSENLKEVHFESPQPVAQTDTVYIEQIRIDTLIDSVFVPYAVKVPESVAQVQIPEFQMNTLPPPGIRSEDLVNSGVASADDSSENRFRPQPFIGM